MKKLTIILITSLLSINLIATNYYVKNDGNNGNTGLSDATAWQTLSYVRGKTFWPGDTIFFKRGHIWKEYLNIGRSGSAGSPIVYTAYGTGPKPIFTCKDTLNGWSNDANWTNLSGNVWYKTMTSRPYRIWIDGTEAKRAYNESGLTAALPWSWNSDGMYRFYVYSTVNPGTTTNEIEIAFRVESPSKTNTINISTNVQYVTLSYLNVQGGSYSIRGVNCDHITVDSCQIGWDSGYSGMRIYSSSTADTCDYITVSNCEFNTNFTINYGDMTYIDSDNEGDLLKFLNNIRHCEVYNCYFKNMRHSGVQVEALTAGYVVEDIKIYDNYFTSPDIDDGRGFAIFAAEGQSTGIEAYNNIINHTHSSNQVSCPHLKIYNNLFIDVHNAICRLPTRVGIGLVMSNSTSGAGYGAAYAMKIYNNTFVGCEDYAIRQNAYYGSSSYDTICNNIIYNCNTYNGDAIAIGIYGREEYVYNNVWKNNLIYADWGHHVDYRGSYLTISDWNSADSDGDEIADNISANPQFLDEIALDFHIKSTSPAINAGITPLTATDKDGVSWDSPPAIGAYEYTSYATPVLPTISTGSVTFRVKNIATISASNCLDAGDGTVSAKGVCWNTTGAPTTSDDKTTDGAGTGSFISTMTGLTSGRTYYVRAYATNEKGTNYGAEISFKIIPFQYLIY
jgi:hypothetical protein